MMPYKVSQINLNMNVRADEIGRISLTRALRQAQRPQYMNVWADEKRPDSRSEPGLISDEPLT